MQRASIDLHLAYARAAARRIARRCPSWVSVDDLLAASYLGAVEALTRTESASPSESSHPVGVTHSAKARIVGAILDELRRGDPMPRRVRARVRRAQRVRDRAAPASVDDGDIARALHMPLVRYRRDIAPLLRCEHVAFDERLTDGAGFDPDTEVSNRRLAAALAALAPRDRSLLDQIYREGCSFDEVATGFGLSRVRIGQLHARALRRLRDVLTGGGATINPAATIKSPRAHLSE